MPETLFESSTVRLFGDTFIGLQLGQGIGQPGGVPAVLRTVQAQLRARNNDVAVPPGLARIYGFSYLGHYYKLPEPTVLLVHGPGQPVPASIADAALNLVGVELKAETFSTGVLMWEQDRTDYTVRIDITPGWLTDVLLEPGTSEGTNMTTGQAPDSGTRGPSSGRAAMVGRAGGCMVGRGNCG
jgi:hypothetical protein